MPLNYADYLPPWIVGLLVVASAFVLIANAFSAIKKLFEPNQQMRKMLTEHEERLKSGDDRFRQQDADNHMVLSCLFVMMNNIVTGNSVNKVKEKRDELQEYLSER